MRESTIKSDTATEKNKAAPDRPASHALLLSTTEILHFQDNRTKINFRVSLKSGDPSARGKAGGVGSGEGRGGPGERGGRSSGREGRGWGIGREAGEEGKRGSNPKAA